jgi:peptide/nickel transport system substrate-binding protein
MSRKITRISAAMMALMFVLAGTTMAAARTGAWVDEVVFVMEEDQNKAVARIESGEFDIYTLGVSQADLFKKIKASPKLDYEVSFGSYNELTFNPAGPVFTGTGKLNPFAIPAIREAVNWLAGLLTASLLLAAGAWLLFLRRDIRVSGERSWKLPGLRERTRA